MVYPVAGQTHHIVLDDGETQLGLMSADNMRTFVRVPVTRTSLKTASGDLLYSDIEPPYQVKAQVDFSGGRGQRFLRDDDTRFSDSNGVDTRFKGQVTLGPELTTFTAANVGIPEHLPGNVYGYGIGFPREENLTGTSEANMFRFGGVNYPEAYAQSFVARGGWIQRVSLYLKSNNGSYNVTVSIRNDANGQPATTSLASSTVHVSNTSWAWIDFNYPSLVTTTIGATYWIVVQAALSENQALAWQYSSSNPYPSGKAMVYANAATGWKDSGSGLNYSLPPNSDFVFMVIHGQSARSQSFNYSGSGTYVVSHLYLLLRRDSDLGVNNIKVELQTDSGGNPSGTLVSGSTTRSLSSADIPTTYSWVRVGMGANITLNRGTTYHIVVYLGSSTLGRRILYWGGDPSAGYTGGSAKWRIVGYTWSSETHDHYFKINSGQGLNDEVLMFFQYQGALYAVAGPPPGRGTGPSTIWMNGYKGRAADNASDMTKLNSANVNGASPGWPTNRWAGCIAYIWSGPGQGEYRTILSNTASSLTVDDPWTTVHTNETHYVILGSNVWTNVSPGAGVGLTRPVTDVLVCNAIVYLCQGVAERIVRYREYWDAGTTTWRRSDGTTGTVNYDGTNYANFMIQIKQEVWRASSTNQISKAAVVDWGTNLTFGTPINIGSAQYSITGLAVYDGDLVVGKEDKIYQVKNMIPEPIPIDFLQMAGPNNCRAMTSWDLFLFFNLGYGLERLYGQHVDDMGPNRDEGLPAGRVGPISCILGAPGTLYVGIDAGEGGYSSVLAWNGAGWHDIVRCPTLGDGVRDLWIQVLPGRLNRLWIAMGNDCAWIPLPEQGVNPLKEAGYTFAPSGELETSWIDMSLADVPKYFHQLKIVSENLLAGSRDITAYYQVDGQEDWEMIGVYTKSPIEEKRISVGAAVTGRRIRFRFVLTTNDDLYTPNLVAYTIESLGRLAPKSRFEPVILIEDRVEMLNGQPDDRTRVEIVRQLDTWAASAKPLTMTTCDPAFTNMTVWIEPPAEMDKILEKGADGTLKLHAGRARLMIMEA